jgi:threonine dehydratase
MNLKVTLEDIQKAQKQLRGVIRATELDKSLSATQLLGVETYIKFENQQYTGSFKFRGAYNKISTLTEEQKKRGVIASSAGNHAQGVARSAQLIGVQATIVMPNGAPLVKAEATRNYGARVIFHGEVVDEAIDYAKTLVKKEGYTFIHPYEDEKIIAGQGTIGLEIHEALPDVDTVLIPIGGGGLISGTAVALKALNPKCRIIGVVSDKAPGMMQLKMGQDFTSPVKNGQTIADGIAVKRPSAVMFRSFIDPYVDQIVSVTDDEIADAIVFLMERMKSVSEGSGAVGLAAALKLNLDLGKKTCIVISGGNIDLNIVSKVIERAQVRKGRLAEISVLVSDLPGSLSQLTHLIAQSGANIIDVRHDRLAEGLALRQTRILFVLETRNFEHIAAIKKQLVESHFTVL